MLAAVSSPPSDQSFDLILAELQQLRTSLQHLDQRFETLTRDNQQLRDQLAISHEARDDLFRQAESLIDQLDSAKRQLETLRSKDSGAKGSGS